MARFPGAPQLSFAVADDTATTPLETAAAHYLDEPFELWVPAPTGPAAGMALGLADWRATSARAGDVRPVQDDAAAAEFQAVAEVFGHPPSAVAYLFPSGLLAAAGVASYIAYSGVEPVAIVSAFVSGDTIAIDALATTPGHRRRGLARRLVEIVIGRAVSGGAARAVVATTAGEAVFARLGFETVCRWDVVNRSAGAPASSPD
jgi:GNAT superfamily N-acetyltransferase